MQDLFARRDELVRICESDLHEIRRTGITAKENEAEYRRLLSIEILKRRADGMPVTIIGDVCKGLPEIAEARLRRDASQVLYEASCEALLVHKKELSMVQSDIEREWRN